MTYSCTYNQCIHSTTKILFLIIPQIFDVKIFGVVYFQSFRLAKCVIIIYTQQSS